MDFDALAQSVGGQTAATDTQGPPASGTVDYDSIATGLGGQPATPAVRPPGGYVSPGGKAGLASIDQKMQGVHQGVAANLPGVIKDAAVTYGQGVKQDFQEGAKDIVKTFNDAKDRPQVNGQPVDQNIGGKILGGIHTTAVVAKTAFSPISRALGPVIQGDAQALSGNKAFSAAANSGVGGFAEHTQEAVQQNYDKFSQKYPTLSRLLGDSYNIGMLFAGEKAEPKVRGIVGDTVDATKSAASDALHSPVTKATLENAGGLPKEMVGTVVEKLQNRYIGQLKDTYDNLLGYGKTGAKKMDLSETAGKNPSQLLAENGIVVDTEKVGGRYQVNSRPAVDNIQTTQVDPLNAQIRNIVSEVDRTTGKTYTLDELATRAKAEAAKSNYLKGTGDLAKVQREIDATVADLKNEMGEQTGLAGVQDIKTGQWRKVTTWDPSRPTYAADANRFLGRAARGTIEDNTPGSLIKDLNSKAGEWYDAMDHLTRVNGQPVKGGLFSRSINRIIGTAAGIHSGGLLGGFVGNLTADGLTDLIQSRAIAGPLKRMILEEVPKDNALYQQAQEALNQLAEKPTYVAPPPTPVSTAVPADLTQTPANMPINPDAGVNINNYQNPQYTKYLPGEEIQRNIERIRSSQNIGKNIDMDRVAAPGGRLPQVQEGEPTHTMDIRPTAKIPVRIKHKAFKKE